VLWDFFKEVDYPWSEIATTRTQIKQDRDLVMRYMRAHVEGIARFKQEPELGKRVIKKMLRLNDDAIAQESWELFSKHRLAAPYPNIKGMKTSYEYVAGDPARRLQSTSPKSSSTRVSSKSSIRPGLLKSSTKSNQRR
jgi:hypothetical protein